MWVEKGLGSSWKCVVACAGKHVKKAGKVFPGESVAV